MSRLRKAALLVEAAALVAVCVLAATSAGEPAELVDTDTPTTVVLPPAPPATPAPVTTPPTSPPVIYAPPPTTPTIVEAVTLERPIHDRCMAATARLNHLPRAPGWGSLVCAPFGIGTLGDHNFAGATFASGGDLIIAPPDHYGDAQIEQLIRHEIGHTWCASAGDLTEGCANAWEANR